MNKPNILFIMADQLRYDYLGCMGHPTIKTPNIDKLAKDGVVFNHTYCQAPVCGASRMSFYTGRYVSSHGATYNGVPLNLNEWTLGDYLRPHGYRVALSGKTHMVADEQGMAKLGIDKNSDLGRLASECGFEPYWRDDGLHPDKNNDPNSEYNTYLRDNGYEGDNPWHDYANSALGENGEILSGWEMQYADRPARVNAKHSETAFTADKAIEFMEEAGDNPWCLHASFIKPHWPYVAPAPYNDMYNKDDIIKSVQCESELDNAHPVYEAFTQKLESKNFSRAEVQQKIIPVYMGLITEFDANVGRMVEYLKSSGQFENTIIVITSDHGDYLGDHWLGEKALFHDPSVRIPLIVFDPRKSADKTRGAVIDDFVEAIDLIPTFVDWAGGNNVNHNHRLEGASLINFVNGTENKNWRPTAISEYDYAFEEPRGFLDRDVERCKIYMVRSHEYKYIYYDDYEPQLFDLKNDPNELNDLVKSDKDKYTEILNKYEKLLFNFLKSRKVRTTITNEKVLSSSGIHIQQGYWIGVWKSSDIN
ncbi:MAG: sulfatase-like hydrolase/transferase [Alphaproteobacteria bacterium]